MCELLQHVRVLDPASDTDRTADVLIQHGVIQAIADALTDYPAEATVQDCRGLVLGPGLVDLYSHSGEPGFEERETLGSLAAAAAAGGFTRLTILPDTVPAIDTLATVTWLHNQQISAPCKIHCWAALTQDAQGQQMTELGELAAAAIVGFADGKPLQNLLLVRRLLEYLKPLSKPIALWPCTSDLVGSGVMREGQESIRFGLSGIPAIAETSALAALLECVEATGTPIHLMRISTARGVEMVRAAKSRGLPITASTAWMHLLLNSRDISSYDPNLRLNPPLGNPEDQAALIQGIREKVVDAIAIDHTPYTYEEKTVAFSEAPAGAIGLEFALPLLWHAFVETGTWSALTLWRALSTHPASCLQQPSPTIALQQTAELVLFDPNKPWVVEPRSLKSLSANTPWLGQEITGRVLNTWCP